MLRFSLLTIEDDVPEEIFDRIYRDLTQWLFVRRGLIELEAPTEKRPGWVKSVSEWRNVVPDVLAGNDLVFCTVDLCLPLDDEDEAPDAENGLQIVREITSRFHEGLRCCVLTGLSASEMEPLLNDEAGVPDVLFDFKGEPDHAYRNTINYIKSQILDALTQLMFRDSSEQTRSVFLQESTGLLRDCYLSRAAYYADKTTWHVPTLLIGDIGLGRRTFVEFVAFLAESTVETVNLEVTNEESNGEAWRRISRLKERFGGEDATEEQRCLIYVANIDKYRPGSVVGDDQNCLSALQTVLEQIRQLGSSLNEGFPVGIIFSVSGDSRLQIRSAETRSFIRLLEDTIGSTTDFPLHHLAMNRNGWTTNHPRTAALPSLRDAGKSFLEGVVGCRLQLAKSLLREKIPAYRDEPVRLTDDVSDLLINKSDWCRHGNLTGLSEVVTSAVKSLADNRATDQFTVTRNHLDQKTIDRFNVILMRVENVSLQFPQEDGKAETVVQKADFHLNDGELLVILGPSGCGKSTILRMLAGLLPPTSGSIWFRNTRVTEPSAGIGFIFQDYSLFPWLTARKNIEYGPRVTGANMPEKRAEIDRLIKVAKLEGVVKKYPAKLSGGEKQRLAIIRALANAPDVLLMDEPFSALDVQTRWEMQNFLIQIKRIRDPESGETVRTNTVVFVTHDIEEAVYLGDRIYVASPKPLNLDENVEVKVPFSDADRNDMRRSDPVFLAIVNRVRNALLNASP